MLQALIVIILLIPLYSHSARSTEWALNLDLKFDSLFFPEKAGLNTSTSFNRLTLVPVYRWKYKEDLRFFLKADLTLDPQNDSQSERVYLDLPELNLRYKKSTYALVIGSTVYNWGVTDGYNPLDIINTKQYFDPLHSKKLGAPSINASWGTETFDLDLVYIPKQRPTILPGEESRWLPRKIFVPQSASNDIILILPESLNYNYGSRRSLNHALDNNFALRLQAHFTGFDLGFIGYEGVATFPLVQPIVTGTIIEVSPKTVIEVDPAVELNLKDYRVRMGGISTVWSSEHFLFKLEASYSDPITSDTQLSGWIQENVLALEKTFNLDNGAMLVALIQYSFINTERKNDSNLSMTEVFRNAWMAGLRLSWSEVWNIQASALFDQNKISHYEELTVSRRFFDTWNASLGAVMITGPTTSPLGIYGKNDSYTFTLSRSF